MNRITELKERICEMKKALYILMEERGDLLDIEVIGASQELDRILNQYYRLLRNKNK